MATWSVEDVCAFLEENGLDEYVASFKANKINGKLLRVMKRGTFLEMVRRRIDFQGRLVLLTSLPSAQGMTELQVTILTELVAESS